MIIKDFDLEDVFSISEIIDKMGLEADIEKITKQIKASKLENKKDATALPYVSALKGKYFRTNLLPVFWTYGLIL